MSANNSNTKQQKRPRLNSEHTQYATVVSSVASVINPMDTLKIPGSQSQDIKFSIQHSKCLSNSRFFEHEFNLVSLIGESELVTKNPEYSLKVSSEKEDLSKENSLLRVETTQLVKFLKNICKGLNSNPSNKLSFALGSRFMFSQSLEPCMEPCIETETIISSISETDLAEQTTQENTSRRSRELEAEIEELKKEVESLRKKNDEMKNLMKISTLEIRREKEKLMKKEVKLETVYGMFSKFFKSCHRRENLINQAIDALEIPEDINMENRAPLNIATPSHTSLSAKKDRRSKALDYSQKIVLRKMGTTGLSKSVRNIKSSSSRKKRRQGKKKDLNILAENLQGIVQKISQSPSSKKSNCGGLKLLKKALKVVESILVCVKKAQVDDVLSWFKTESGRLEVIKEDREEEDGTLIGSSHMMEEVVQG